MATDIDWDLYRTFLGVLRQGSLSGAARALGLTQPTVGRHVDALETIVGRQLFTRSQHGLLPTDTAIALRPYAEALEGTAAALLRAASGAADAVAGSVRISASEVIGVEVLLPILAGLQDRHPGIAIELSASDKVEDLLQREADIAVRMVKPTQDALLVQPIGTIQIGFFAHRAYLETHGTPASIADLHDHRLIGFDRQTAFVRSMTRRYPVLEGMSFAFRSDHGIAINNAIRAGMGIGLLQVPLGLRERNLVRLLPENVIPLETWVAMHENLKSSPRCRATFDALVAGLRAYMA